MVRNPYLQWAWLLTHYNEFVRCGGEPKDFWWFVFWQIRLKNAGLTKW